MSDMKFQRIHPQVAQGSDGCVVRVHDRSHVEYVKGSNRAIVEADFSSTIGIYADTLELFGPPSQQMLSAKDIISRIVAGMQCLGSRIELLKSPGSS